MCLLPWHLQFKEQCPIWILPALGELDPDLKSNLI